MESKTYSALIKFEINTNDTFVSQIDDQKTKNRKPLNSSDPAIIKYIKAVQKFFSEIAVLPQCLWIFPLISTSKVRIYFSDPQIYPVSQCCQKAVYIDIQSNLNGSIICPNCNLILVDFVYYNDDDRKSMSCSGSDQLTQNQKKRLFRQKRKHNLLKSRMLSDNLTSNKFKTRNLKRMIESYEDQIQCSSASNNMNSQLKRQLNRQSDLGCDLIAKDGFILQIKQFCSKNAKKNYSLKPQTRNSNNFIEYNNNKMAQHAFVDCSPCMQFDQGMKRKQESIQQTKKIILDIFSFSI